MHNLPIRQSRHSAVSRASMCAKRSTKRQPAHPVDSSRPLRRPGSGCLRLMKFRFRGRAPRILRTGQDVVDDAAKVVVTSGSPPLLRAGGRVDCGCNTRYSSVAEHMKGAWGPRPGETARRDWAIVALSRRGWRLR